MLTFLFLLRIVNPNEVRNIEGTAIDEKIERNEGRHARRASAQRNVSLSCRDDAHQELPEKVAAREWGGLESFEG